MTYPATVRILVCLQPDVGVDAAREARRNLPIFERSVIGTNVDVVLEAQAAAARIRRLAKGIIGRVWQGTARELLS
jgi:hypothetical protein